MNYSHLKQYINDLAIPPNGRYRGNCPVCGNKNTFSLVQDGLETFYNCFHIECKTKGVMKNGLSLDICNSEFNGNGQSRFEIRQNVSKLEFSNSNTDCDRYLSNYGSFDRAFLKYDPKQHRLVFPLEYKGENYGYVGRALDRRVIPKWYVYLRRMGCPYIPQRSSDDNNYAVLVEDCLSALRAVAYFNCIALLGTTINAATIPYLLNYDRLYVALDPDALSKSLTLQRTLSYYRDTRILSIKNDLKYYSNEDLQKLKEELEND